MQSARASRPPCATAPSLTDLRKRLGTTAEEQLATSVRTPIRSSFLRRRRRTGPRARTVRGTHQSCDAAAPNPGTVPPLDALVLRVRGEYGEMPGLQLTVSQASRLWQVEMSTCES